MPGRGRSPSTGVGRFEQAWAALRWKKRSNQRSQQADGTARTFFGHSRGWVSTEPEASGELLRTSLRFPRPVRSTLVSVSKRQRLTVPIPAARGEIVRWRLGLDSLSPRQKRPDPPRAAMPTACRRYESRASSASTPSGSAPGRALNPRTPAPAGSPPGTRLAAHCQARVPSSLPAPPARAGWQNRPSPDTWGRALVAGAY